MLDLSRRTALLLIAILLALPALAKPATVPPFPEKDLMTVGVYYYPEHWEEAQWDRDFAKMEELGFEFVHMGEFAWTFMEPEDGKFDFAWLDRAVEFAARHHLRVVLCTPTPCPPAWLAESHPEIFLVREDGRKYEHGSRANNALHDPTFRRYSERVITELAKRYGKNPAVVGWQLDNEPNSPPDFSPSSQQAFREWLRARYKTIDALNREWGTAFWSLRYNDFDQIRISNTSLLYGPNPHAVLDFHRFMADTTGEFLNWQAALLRRHTAPSQWITSNFICTIGGSDPRRATDLDFTSFTLYPVSGGKNLGDEGFRLGWPDGMQWGGAFYRPIKGATGVMELQPGQVNWSWVNPQPMPGVVRMWLWNAFAVGCSFACTYRYRQPLYGSEQYHNAIIGTDGVTPSPGGLEYARVIREIKDLRGKYDARATPPAGYTARATAILWSHENLWNIDQQKQTNAWDTWGHMFRYMESAESCGAPVDVVGEDRDLSKYPVVIAPAYQLVDAQLVEKWTRYVENGGNLVLTCRTAQKQRNGQLWEGPWAAPILPLIGAKIRLFDLLRDDVKANVAMKGTSYPWYVWGDVLDPGEGTEALATYADQFYAGAAAVTYRRVGKGSVTYVGVHTRDGRLEHEVLREVYARANVPVASYPDGVYVNWRDGFWVAVNYSSTPAEIPLPKGAEVLVGANPLGPADVLVWR